MKKSHIAVILANILILGSLSGLYAYLSETAEDEPEDEPDIVHQEVATWTVFYTSSSSSLPTCDSDSMGWLYYVGVDQNFRVCTASGWEFIDLTGPRGLPGTPGQDGTDGINGLDGIHGINGLDGTDGINGTNGTNGTDGIDGQEGKFALVKMSTEPIGNHCEFGGLRVQVGVDDNRNGVLDGNEIDLTEFVCHGAPGSGGNQPPPNVPQGRVTDINFGSGDSLWFYSWFGTSAVLTSGDVLYFPATDSVLGYEIWAYNITSGNVWMIADLNNGSGSISSFGLLPDLTANQTLLLSFSKKKFYVLDYANSTITDFQHSVCLGNSTTTSNLNYYFAPAMKFGNKLYGAHQDGRLGYQGSELWAMDLTNGTCSLIEDIRGGTYEQTPGNTIPLSSYPRLYSIVGNLICFIATTGPNNNPDNQLWCHDPAINSTWRVTDTYPAGDDAISSLRVIGTTLYFRGKFGGGVYDFAEFAFDSSNGTAWEIADHLNCPAIYMAYNFEIIGSKAYWISNENGSNSSLTIEQRFDNYQFWVVDLNNGSCWQASNYTGPTASTFHSSGIGGAQIKKIVGTSIIFSFDDDVAGSELWIFETTNNSLWRITDVWAGGHSYDSNPIVLGLFGNTLYFRAYDGQTGTELWAYGMNNGTVWQVIDINRGGPNDSSNPGSRFFVELGSSICFDADDGVHGLELWCI